MPSKQHLGFADYAVLGISLFIPAVTGLYFKLYKRQRNSLQQYLLAGKNASMIPVVMSISVTVMSAILMLGFPAEIYKYGSQYTLVVFSTIIGMFLSSRVFLPVYFRCNVTSIYEFLETRFGKLTRNTISAVFIVQNQPCTWREIIKCNIIGIFFFVIFEVLYMSTVLLGPVLALSAVTEFSTPAVIVICGIVCTFYCVLGGLNAVMWTDVFQAVLMFSSILIMIITATAEIGTISEIYDRAKNGNRLQFFNFRFDFETRYTVWSSLLRGFVFGLAYYGTSQIEVQRSLSMSSCKRAQSALQWSTIPVAILEISCCLLGILIYAVFYLCDPVLNHKETGIHKYDQIVPYFIITRLQHIPGLTGLCVAGIFSGSLSTMSSALNSLATVTIVDFIQPIFSQTLTEERVLLLAKISGLVYGTICICLAFVLANLESIVQMAAIFQSSGEGPVLGVFLIGVLTTKASDRCSVLGLLVGIAAVTWIGYGSLFSGYQPLALSLETNGCPGYTNYSQHAEGVVPCSDIQICLTENSTNIASEEVFGLYKVPFTLIPIMGCTVTILATFSASLLLDKFKDVVSKDSKCLSPFMGNWMSSFPPIPTNQETESKTPKEQNELTENKVCGSTCRTPL